MAVFAKPLHQPAKRRVVQVDLALGSTIGLAHIVGCNIGGLRGAGITLVAVTAVVVQQRVDVSLEQGRVGRKVLAVARILDGRFFQVGGAAAQANAFSGPGADPGADLIGTELRIGFPAIMATGHFLHHLRGGGLVQVDEWIGCRIGLVDVAGLYEGGGLVTVTGATALRVNQVVPDIDFEGGNISIARSGAIIADATVATGIRVGLGVGTTAAAAATGEEGGQQGGCKNRISHRLSPPCSKRPHRQTGSSCGSYRS